VIKNRMRCLAGAMIAAKIAEYWLKYNVCAGLLAL
jgi:hypothetical protein